jgi:HEAT repeat protein
MSEPRKRVFGPLLCAALVVWGLATLYSGVEVATPRLQRWLAQRQVVQNLRSADPGMRRRTIEALLREDITPFRSELVAALRDPAVEVRVAAARLLVSRGLDQPLMIPILAAAASDARGDIRLEVARILGLIEAFEARQAASPGGGSPGPETEVARDGRAVLGRLLKDPSSDVRAAAADSMSMAGLSEAMASTLADAAGDADSGVRLAVAAALLKCGGPGDPKAAEILCALVADPEALADRAVVKTIQTACLETQARAASALMGLLANGDPLILPDVIDCVREGFPEPEVALPALTKLLDHTDPAVRAAAATTIATIEGKLSPRVLKALVALVADKDLPQEKRQEAMGRVQEAAPKALAGATPELVRQLGDQSADVRRFALELLGPILEDQPAALPASPGRE